VLRLIFAFVEIMLHRRGPEHLPAAGFLFGTVLLVSLAVELAALRLSAVVERPLLLTLVDTALDLVFVWAVLRLFDRERRFKQTATALLGADTLLNLLSLPLVLWNQSLEGATAPALLFLLLAIWSIDIAGFILSRTLERPYALGVAIMLGYVLLSISLRMSFFPTTS
jgi:hypothetical protein